MAKIETTGSGSGVGSIGTINSQTKSADGAVVAGTDLVMQTADATYPGLVSTGAQTIAGVKTFNDDINLASTGKALTVNGVDFVVQPNADSTSIAIGLTALDSMSATGLANVAIGNEAGTALTTGAYNTMVGHQTNILATNTTYNTAVGYQAMALAGAAGSNVAIGVEALKNIIGNQNVGIGTLALGITTSSFESVAVGHGAMLFAGNYNTGIGKSAGEGVTGVSNTIIGHKVGSTTLTTGGSNVLIGTSDAVTTLAAGTSNFLNVGNTLFGTSVGTGTVGAPAGRIGILNTAPATALDVTGTITASQIIDSGLTADTAIYANGSKQLTSSATTATELGYVSGVTSAIQTQLNGKVATTGNETIAGIKTFSSAPILSSLTASLPLQLDASKNITSTAIDLSTAQVTGTLPIARGGTNNGSLAVTAGGTLYTDGSKLVNVGAGTSGQVLTSNGASAPTWESFSPTQSYELANVGLAVTVAANVLTIALKQSDGSTDPSTGSAACKIGFRTTTATDGAYSQVTATAATSLVISSGSTLGTVAALTHYLYVYAINNAGTIELGVSGLKLLDDGVLTTSVAEGGAGAADTAGVLYSTTARTTKAIRLIGRIKISEATAGTWASAPTEVSVVPFDTNIVVNARYSTAAAQSISGSTTTIVDFGTKDFDFNSTSASDSVTTGASWKFTASVPGKYNVSAAIVWGSTTWTATAYRRMMIYKNGSLHTVIYKDNAEGSPASALHGMNGGGLVNMVAGDYVDIRIDQNHGTVALYNDAAYVTVSIFRAGN